MHRLDPGYRGRRLLYRARDHWRQRRRLDAVVSGIGGIVLTPRIAFYYGAYPLLWDWVKRALEVVRPRVDADVLPETAALLEETQPWPDGWVGPRLATSIQVDDVAEAVEIRGWQDLSCSRRPFVLRVSVDGSYVGQHTFARSGDFSIRFPLPRAVTARVVPIEVRASSWYVRHRLVKNRDYRPLSWRFGAVRMVR
jgi:hypothetical protein